MSRDQLFCTKAPAAPKNKGGGLIVNNEMDKFPVTIKEDEKTYRFEVVDYMHHRDEKCQFEAYLDGRLVASFEPDRQDHLQVCNNQGGLAEAILHRLTDEIESHHW